MSAWSALGAELWGNIGRVWDTYNREAGQIKHCQRTFRLARNQYYRDNCGTFQRSVNGEPEEWECCGCHGRGGVLKLPELEVVLGLVCISQRGERRGL